MLEATEIRDSEVYVVRLLAVSTNICFLNTETGDLLARRFKHLRYVHV
jgi:hypothetical protein